MLQQVFNTLIAASIYALFAMGYALVFGVLDILNLAHGAIFMCGAFAAVQAVLGWHWPLLLALPFGMLVGGMLGVVLDLVAVAPLTTRGGDFLTPLISTIAAGIVFENVALGAFGPDAYGFPLGTFPSGSIAIGDAVVQPIDLFIVGLTVALMVGLTVFLRASKLGKAIRAVAANRLAAQLVGIDVAWTIVVTFFLASALGALAGIVYGLEFGSAIQFDMGGSIQLRGLAVIVVGGMGSIPGVMLGSLLLAASETVGVTEVGSPYRDAFAFALLFLVLLVRPSGLLGRRGLRTG
jgi:branched-chain amino acid transport system permease protein